MGWRGDVRDTFKTSLDVWSATLGEPPQIKKARPAALANNRTVYIGGISEEIAQDSGTQRRVAEVTLVCCVHLGENAETTDELEDMADSLVDWLTTNFGLTGALTYQEPIRTVTTEIAEGGIFIPAIAVVARAFIQQGRA